MELKMKLLNKQKHTPFELVMLAVIFFGFINSILAVVSGIVIILEGFSHLQPGANTISVIAIEYYGFLFSSVWIAVMIIVSIVSFAFWVMPKLDADSSPNSPSNIRMDRKINFYIDKFLNFLSLTEKKIIHWYNN